VYFADGHFLFYLMVKQIILPIYPISQSIFDESKHFIYRLKLDE